MLAVAAGVDVMRGWALLMMLAASACASSNPTSIDDETRTAVIFGTIGQSEWCPAGNVRVDLETGRYVLTARASRDVCQNADLERPTAEGTLNAAKVRTLRRAFQRATLGGLDGCRGGQRLRQDEIVISNGGLHVLVVTDGHHTGAAPTDLSCWTDAAWVLHRILDDTFPTPDWAERPLPERP